MKGYYITYDGILSAKYGLQRGFIGDSNGSQNISVYSPNISVSNSKNLTRFYITDKVVDKTKEEEIQLIARHPLNEQTIRDVLAWLNKSDFKKIIFHNKMQEEYYRMCIFKKIEVITVRGVCVGFSMTAVYDSPYSYGKETIAKLPLGVHEYKQVKINNKSDVNEYIYPQIKIKTNSAGDIKIKNLTDSNDRVFELKNIPANAIIDVDNELKIFNAVGTKIKLEQFNKKWLRVKRGINILEISGDAEIEIICPQLKLSNF